MIPARVIEAKRDGHVVEAADLRAFFEGYLAGDVPDYQVSAFLMAVQLRGMRAEETRTLVDVMLRSGGRIERAPTGRPRIDKHSTGGIGDKVSLVLAPLAAELGIDVPMMSGRGLGHTTGTLDKLEAIPGFRVDLPAERFREVLERLGCAMTGQTEDVAPLDRRLYALRDVTGTVPAIPLIAASIMSKKLAETLDGLVLDVKVGDGAFISTEDGARELARTMVRVGHDHGLPTRAVLTAMDRPLGSAVGNGLETAEAIRCLAGGGPDDLVELVTELVAEMGVLAGLGEASAVAREARTALESGRALERFGRLVDAQGGDARVLERPETLCTAPEQSDVRAGRAGVVVRVRPRPLGEAVVSLGGGRRRVEDAIHHGVGFEVDVRPGDVVGMGDRLGRVHALDPAGLTLGARVLADAVVIDEDGEAAPSPLPLIVDRIGPSPD